MYKYRLLRSYKSAQALLLIIGAILTPTTRTEQYVLDKKLGSLCSLPSVFPWFDYLITWRKISTFVDKRIYTSGFSIFNNYKKILTYK